MWCIPSFHQRNVPLDIVDVPNRHTSVQRFRDDQHVTVHFEATVERSAEILGQPEPVGVLQVVGVNDLEEHIIANDFRCGYTIVCV